MMIKFVVMRRFLGNQPYVANDYQSFEELLEAPGCIKRRTILKISYQLAQTLAVLHSNSLFMEKFDEKSIFVAMKGKEV
jgi:hypothetical protein